MSFMFSVQIYVLLLSFILAVILKVSMWTVFSVFIFAVEQVLFKLLCITIRQCECSFLSQTAQYKHKYQ